MKRITMFCLLAAISFAGISQKIVNDANAEKRTVSSFHAIEVGGGVDLYLSQGNEAVAVSASDTKYRDRIKTEVVNGVLKISYQYEKGLKINWSGNKMNLKAYVSFKELDKLRAGGGSDVKVDGSIKVSKLDLGVSSGSDFMGMVDIVDLKASASGGSDIKISGSTKTLGIDASGGSDFKGFDLTTENCAVDASGGSKVSINATKELNVQSSGGSDVYYKGSAMIRNIKSSGGGSVKKTSK